MLTSVLGALGCMAAVVAIPAGVVFLPLDRTLHAKSYRPATFPVAWVTYSPAGRRTAAGYWAVGTVDGHRERFGLDGVVTRVQGWDDLEAQVKPGRQIKVLYDPSFSKQGDGRGLRVIRYEDYFAARQKQRLLNAAILIYGPSLLLMGASIAVGSTIGRWPLGTAGLTVFLLVAGAAGIAFIHGLR